MTTKFDAEQVDQLLTEFFRAKLPTPFPPLRAPAAEIVPASVLEVAPAAEPVGRPSGRAVLAASGAWVALLAGVCWYLSDALPTSRPPRPDELPGDATATVPPELRAPAVTGPRKR